MDKIAAKKNKKLKKKKRSCYRAPYGAPEQQLLKSRGRKMKVTRYEFENACFQSNYCILWMYL